jgi:hypothetical protein
MLLHLITISTDPRSTLSALLVDGTFECFALEDTFHYVKVDGHTRIPEGKYPILLRHEGGMDYDYRQRFGKMHKGMLWVMDVPNFRWIYLHCGNAPKDTQGCILVGDKPSNNQYTNPWLGDSETAYKRLYPKVAGAISRGEMVYLRVSRLA